MPWEAVKKLEGEPLMSRAKLTEDMHPIIHDSLQWHTNLQKNEPDIGPINSIKGFSDIKLEDKDTFVSGFERVQDFLGDGYSL